MPLTAWGGREGIGCNLGRVGENSANAEPPGRLPKFQQCRRLLENIFFEISAPGVKLGCVNV